MDLFRPAILSWTTPGTPGGEDENGFPIPEIPGVLVQVPARFVSGGTKTFKNEDSIEVVQNGRIRFDAGGTVPLKYQIVRVTEGDRVHFEGPAMEIYTGGHLKGWRIDV